MVRSGAFHLSFGLLIAPHVRTYTSHDVCTRPVEMSEVYPLDVLWYLSICLSYNKLNLVKQGHDPGLFFCFAATSSQPH